MKNTTHTNTATYNVVQNNRDSCLSTRFIPSSSRDSNLHRDSPASSISFQYLNPTSNRPPIFFVIQKSPASKITTATKLCTKFLLNTSHVTYLRATSNTSHRVSHHPHHSRRARKSHTYATIGLALNPSINITANGCFCVSGTISTALIASIGSGGRRALNASIGRHDHPSSRAHARRMSDTRGTHTHTGYTHTHTHTHTPKYTLNTKPLLSLDLRL